MSGIKVLRKTKRELELEIKGEDHTFLNALKSALLQNEDVKIATYDIEFPSISDPILYLRTKDSDPIEALKDASALLSKQCDEFKRKFKKKAQ